MPETKSHAVQAALAVARSMRRPSRLLLAMISRAERVEPDDGLRGLTTVDFASTLASLLAHAENAPAIRRGGRTKMRGAGAPARPLRAVSDVERTSPAGTEGARGARGSGRAAPHRELAPASRSGAQTESPDAATPHARSAHLSPDPKSHAEQMRRDASQGRALIAAARDRLRATGQVPMRQRSPSIVGVDADFPQSRVWTGRLHPGSAEHSTSEMATAAAIANRAPARSAPLSVETPPDAIADPSAVDPSRRVRGVGAQPSPAVTSGVPPAETESSAITQRSTALADPLPAPLRLPDPLTQRTIATLMLDDDATALLEEAYRHGVDLTWR